MKNRVEELNTNALRLS